MEKLRDLLKRSLDLWAKKCWLKEIDTTLKNYKKFSDKAFREHYTMNVLIKRYNELYPQDQLEVKGIEQSNSTSKARWLFWEGWMSNHDMRIDDATCSNCGYKHPTVRRTYGVKETEQEVLSKLFKFCPNCGKSMDKNNN